MRAPAKYARGDKVCFIYNNTTYKGIIEIVDAYGIFTDSSEPYYDIKTCIKENNLLIKHIPQSSII
jgi:hypothetical protein